MRLFAVLVLVLFVSFAWAMWQGIDLAADWLMAATNEETNSPALDGSELIAEELGAEPTGLRPEAPLEQAGLTSAEPAQDVSGEASAERVVTVLGSSEVAEPPSTEADLTVLGAVEAPALDAAADPSTQVLSAPAAVVIAEPSAGNSADPEMRRITGDRVNLREGPDASTASLGLLFFDDSVVLLENDGDWQRVRTSGGKEGWVAARFLAPSLR